MNLYQGDYAEDATVYVMFNTFTSNDPSASSTITNFINTDVHIHKDDDLTQRNSAAGITVSVNFDGITGSHMIKIDTSDDTVAGFWVTGKDYFIRIEGTTVDGATINAVVGHFSIENRFKEVDLTHILGHLLTQTGTQLADGFQAFFDTANPTTMLAINLPNQTMDITGDITGNLSGSVGSVSGHTNQTGDSYAIVNNGTYGNAALETLVDEVETILKHATYGLSTIETLVDDLESRLTATRAGYLDNLSGGAVALVATALSNTTWTNTKAGYLDHSISTVDGVVDGIQTDLSNATDGLGALKSLIDTVNGVVDSILADTGTDGVLLATTALDAIRTEPLTDTETAETIGGCLHAIYCAQLQKQTVTASARAIYKLDDTAILRTQTLSDDDTTVIRGGG